MLTTQFFGMKIQRYMHEHGISKEVLAKVGGQGVPQRRQEPQRVPWGSPSCQSVRVAYQRWSKSSGREKSCSAFDE